MITEEDWNKALRSPVVHELARQVLTFLQDRGEEEMRSPVIDWALQVTLGDRRVTYAEYYAAWMLVLNPWQLERLTRKERKREQLAARPARGTITPEALRQRWKRRSELLKRWSQIEGVHGSIWGRYRAYESIISWLNQGTWTAATLPHVKQELLALIERSGQEVEEWREKNDALRKTRISGSRVQLEVSRARAQRRELRKALKELQEVMDMPRV